MRPFLYDCNHGTVSRISLWRQIITLHCAKSNICRHLSFEFFSLLRVLIKCINERTTVLWEASFIFKFNPELQSNLGFRVPTQVRWSVTGKMNVSTEETSSLLLHQIVRIQWIYTWICENKKFPNECRYILNCRFQLSHTMPIALNDNQFTFRQRQHWHSGRLYVSQTHAYTCTAATVYPPLEVCRIFFRYGERVILTEQIHRFASAQKKKKIVGRHIFFS